MTQLNANSKRMHTQKNVTSRRNQFNTSSIFICIFQRCGVILARAESLEFLMLNQIIFFIELLTKNDSLIPKVSSSSSQV